MFPIYQKIVLCENEGKIILELFKLKLKRNKKGKTLAI